VNAVSREFIEGAGEIGELKIRMEGGFGDKPVVLAKSMLET
jgi:hypothetical protein